MEAIIFRNSALAGLVVPLVAFAVVQHLRRQWKMKPPGPIGLPLLGNIFQMPVSQHWLVFSRWAKLYGKRFYLS